MKLTKNFNKSEFECKCGCEMPEDVSLEITKLSSQLQYIRDFVRQPIKITSGYRCESHNKSIGGVSNLQLILGRAADIQVENMTQPEVFDTIHTLTEHGHILQGGIRKYNTFTHYDIRKIKARWDKTIE